MESEDIEIIGENGIMAGNCSTQAIQKEILISQKINHILNYLSPVLPPSLKVKYSSNLLEDFRRCEKPGTVSDVAHVISPDYGMRNVCLKHCFGSKEFKTDTQCTIRTEFVKRIYERLLSFLQLNDTPQYRNVIDMGFGKNFTIRVNSCGEALLELYVNNTQDEEYRKPLSEILEKLKDWFCSSDEDCKVSSLVIQYFKSESKRTVLYGNPYLSETVSDMKFLISGSYLCAWHPCGMKLFSEALLDLANLNEKSGVIQIGCVSAVPTLLMAKSCKKLAVIDSDENFGKFLSENAEKNNIKNIMHLAVDIKGLGTDFLDSNFRPCNTVCAVIYKLDDTRAENFLKQLQKCYKINKIIFILKLKYLGLLKRLVFCCRREDKNSDGFLVTRAIPVDVTPFQTNVEILFLLERESDINMDVLLQKCKKTDPSDIPVEEIKLDDTEKSKLKELSAVKQAELISSIMMPFLPKLVKDRESNKAFHLEPLQLCPQTETLSDVLEVHTGVDPSTQCVELKYTTSMYGKSVPVVSITSDTIKKVYEELIEFFPKLKIPLYHPTRREGFWKRAIIRMNHGGSILMIIEYQKEFFKTTNARQRVETELKTFVNDLTAKGLIVGSLLVKVCSRDDGSFTKCLFGPNVLYEAVDGFIIGVSDRPYTIVNQHAVSQLSHSIASMAQINSSCTVLQLGAGYDAVTLYLSKLCKQFYMICDKMTTGIQTSSNAISNKISNFFFYSKGMPRKSEHELLKNLILTELTQEENICVLLYEFPQGPNDGISEILMAKNIKKIVFMAELDIETQVKKLVAFCNHESQFVLTKAIPVDISPQAENVKMIFLLERESLVSDSVEDNTEFSVDNVNAVLQEQKKLSSKNDTLPKTEEKALDDAKPSSPDADDNFKPPSREKSGQEKSGREKSGQEKSGREKSGQEKPTVDKIFDKPVSFQKPIMQVPPKQIIVKPIQIVSRFNVATSSSVDTQNVPNTSLALGKPKSEKELERHKKKVQEYVHKSNKKAYSDKKKVIAANIHDDWCTGLDLEDNFHMQVAKLIQEKPLETTTDYEGQLAVKQMYAMAQAKCLSDVLEPIVPVITKHHTPELIFQMQDLKSCPLIKSDSYGFQVVTGIDANSKTPEMKFEFSSPYKSLPMRAFNSVAIESTYKHLMNVISKSELELYNPQSKKGFWKRISMKVNDDGEKLIVIEAYSNTKNVAKKLSMKAMEELQSYFKSKAADFNTGPIMLKVYCNSNLLSYRMIFWKSFMKENISGFEVKICDDLHLWIQDPIGLAVLSNAILELGQFKKSTTVIQVGYNDGITFMNLSKQCRRVVMVHEDLQCGVEHQFTLNADENNIRNLSVCQIRKKEEFQDLLMDRHLLKSESDICALIFNYAFLSDCLSSLLRNSHNITKVICVSDSRNVQELKSVFTLCRETNVRRAFMSNNTEKAFCITKAVSVDLSPYGSSVKMLYLLERVADLQGQTKLNDNYYESKVSEFEKIKTLQRKAPKLGDTKSSRETRKMLSVLKLCEGRKPCVISSSEFKGSQKIISDYRRRKDSGNGNYNTESNWDRSIEEMDHFDIPGKHILTEENSEQVINKSDGNQLINKRNRDTASLSSATIENTPKGQQASKIAENLIKNSLHGGKINTVAKNLIEIGFLLANKASTITGNSNFESQTDKLCSEGTTGTGIGKEDDPCEMAYRLKRREVFKSVKSVSDALKSALPTLDARGNFGLLFHLSDLRPCPMTKTQCDVLQAFSGINPETGKIDMIPQGRGSRIQSVDVYSDGVRYLYNKILEFMKSSSFEMYDPDKNSGFWDSVCIIVNDLGEAMIVVKGFALELARGMEERMSELSTRLRNCFLEDAAKKHVVSLVFRIAYTNMTNVKVLIGEDNLSYNFGTFKIQMFENSPFFSNPYGLELLCNTLIDVADLNYSYRVLQLGSEFDLLSLKLSKECQKIYVFDVNKKIGEHLLKNMSRNNVSNVDFIEEDGNNQFLRILEYEIRSAEDICVIIYGNLKGVSGDTHRALMRDIRVKKILLVSEQLGLSDVKTLISLCKEVYYCSDPFIIKKVVPVEMCPYSTCVKMVYLLVRKSDSICPTITTTSHSGEIQGGDVNYMKDKRNVLQSDLSAQARAVAGDAESSVGQFSRETHFAARHELRGSEIVAVDKSEHKNREQLPFSSLHSLNETEKGLVRANWEENICSTQQMTYKNVLPDAKVLVTDNNEPLDLDSECILQTRIINAVYRGGGKTPQQLREIAQWKTQWISSQAKKLSESLKDVLPVLVRNPSKGLIFFQDDIISCPAEDPPYCTKFEVFSAVDRNTGQLTMAYSTYPDGSLYPVTHFRSYVFQCLYERVMEFIKASGFRLYNPNDESGLWKRIVITINQSRESMLLLTGQALKSSSLNFKAQLEGLRFILRQYLSSGEVRDCRLVSAVIHAKFASDDVTIPVIGDGTMDYRLHSMDVCVHALTVPWPSIHIVKEVSNTIVKLAKLDKTWSVIQIGCGYVFEALCLAQTCKKVLVFDSSVEQGNCITKSAEKNDIDLVCLPEKILSVRFNQIFKTDLSSSKNICLVINKCDERFFNVWLRRIPEIKQIIWITKLGADEVFRTLCHLCDKNDDKKDPFLILEAIPVDLSVYENDIDVIYHLTRQSRTPYFHSNLTYFEEQCKKLCGISDSKVSQTKDSPSSIQSTQKDIGGVNLKRKLELVATDNLERCVKSQKYDDHKNFEESDANLITSQNVNKFAPNVRSVEGQSNYQSPYKNIKKSADFPPSDSESLRNIGQIQFGQNAFSRQYSREVEHVKQGLNYQAYPSTFVKELPQAGKYLENLSYQKNAGESSSFLSYERDATVSKGYEAQRDPSDHMSKRNDFITFHYDHTSLGNRGSLSSVNVGNTRLQNEPFQRTSNTLESGVFSSDRMSLSYNPGMRTNEELLHHRYYRDDNRQGEYQQRGEPSGPQVNMMYRRNI